MIRHPLHSAVGRVRPDLNRVTDGISASLRQFSISASRSSFDDDSKGKGSGSDNNDRPRPSSRQKSADTFKELLAVVDNVRPSSSSSKGATISKSQLNTFTRSKDITVSSLSDDNSFRKDTDRNIIRGGFRPRARGGEGNFAASRGAFSRDGGGGGGRGGRGRGGNNFAPSRGAFGRDGGGGRGGRGRGGFSRSGDDRPRRGRGGARGGRGRGRGRGNEDKGQTGEDKYEPGLDDPRIKEYFAEQDTGDTTVYNPALSIDLLAGWGPAVATSSSPFGRGETVLRAARILAGGQAYHPSHVLSIRDTANGYRHGNGLFIPPSKEGKEWIDMWAKGKTLVRPDEVKTAVLEDTLLGMYGEGPKYADPNDTIGVLRSYVKRDGTWNAHASRSIEAKMRSMLGLQAEAEAGAGTGAAEAGEAKQAPKA
ncbi:hypothetical protein GGR54DRAFT_529432 [Hypoxylon sp. NC1633]|nr:hypothetical protein GGR54DRAFT_529432 [Hypoxylon sp. NC1633]